MTKLHLSLIILLFISFPLITFAQADHDADGKASYYAKKFQGRKTANGELFNNFDYTAAHRTLPFNTYLNVINTKNKYNVIVRVNDRGPYAKNRVVDLSEAAARRIGGYEQGLVHVRLEVLDLIHLTPDLEQIYHSSPVVDCLGNISELSGISLSVWSSNDLVHAIYVANDLYLKENVDKVFIATRNKSGKRKYHVIISEIETKESAQKLKDSYERKGFMKVTFYEP